MIFFHHQADMDANLTKQEGLFHQDAIQTHGIYEEGNDTVLDFSKRWTCFVTGCSE